MPLFLFEDESKHLGKKSIPISKTMGDNFTQLATIYDDKEHRDQDGFKRIKHLASLVGKDGGTYNKRKDGVVGQIPFSMAKRIDHDIEHMNPNSESFKMIGGYQTQNFIKDGLRGLRDKEKETKAVPQVKQVDINKAVAMPTPPSPPNISKS